MTEDRKTFSSKVRHTEAGKQRLTAWDNPAWVLAVMHYPDDPLLLDRVALGAEIHVRIAAEGAIQTEAARAGKVAGNVLAILYAVDRSGWNIRCAPSLAVAHHCAGQLELAERAADARLLGQSLPRPRGHTKIEETYNRMRSVAHLWAAFRLHWEFPKLPHDELMRTNVGTLLSIARSVQEWAIKWTPPRSRRYKPLLGESPWLIPASVRAIEPRWPVEPSDLLRQALSAYRRRQRG